MFKKAISITFVLCFSILIIFEEAKASLIAVNDSTYGIPKWGVPITLDTTTRLEWMNIQITANNVHYVNPNYQYNQLLTVDLAPGGVYSGWTLASSTQVFTLMGDAGMPAGIFDDQSDKY